MRFARLIAATVVVVTVAAGGLFVLAPETAGQARRVIVDAGGTDLEVLHLGGRPSLGVAIRDVDQADVTREKLAAPAGAVVEEVRSESPAAKAGLKSGDVIIAFDGERVRSARQLERLVEETPAGRPVKLAVQRGGSKVDLDVTPETSDVAFSEGSVFKRFEPSGEDAFRSELAIPRFDRDWKRRIPAMEFDFDGLRDLGGIPARGRLGVSVQDLSDQLAAYFGVKAGVVVGSVDDGSPASKAGVKAGDVITAVNGQAIEDPADLRREVSKIEEGKPAELSVTRDKKPLALKVEIEPAKKTERRVRRTV